jgi:hypothetical protein
MAKNVVILSDGTGQGASMPKAERTNVWKLWRLAEYGCHVATASLNKHTKL